MSLAAALAFAVLAPGGAQARPKRLPAPVCGNADVMRPCAATIGADRGSQRGRGALNRSGRGLAITGRRARHGPSQAVYPPAVLLPHPAGCPPRAFCGCGAAVRVFGRPVRELWLAINWLRFPRALPAAGMVAVRRHHVFVLEQDLGAGVWLAFDANSGGHATRRHARALAGYTIVDPRAGA